MSDKTAMMQIVLSLRACLVCSDTSMLMVTSMVCHMHVLCCGTKLRYCCCCDMYSFYQHVEGSSKWDWHIVWGHVSSPDMVRWTHEPIALSPSVAGHDKAGCWSGNTTLDESGVPTILYTAVR